MNIDIDIACEEKGWDQIPDLEGLCRTAIQAALAETPELDGSIEINLLLSGDERVRRLNLDYRGQDKPTNILSFPGDDAPGAEFSPFWLGDLVLALETVRSEAVDQRKPLGSHLTHLLIHGVLHLLGYDHISEDDAIAMEQTEIRIMERLGYPDPYANLGEPV